MEINTPSKINPQYEINKTQIQTLLEPTTTKPDDKNGTRIYPYLSVDLCDNLIYQNVLLKTCIEVLAEDTVFNDISVTNNNNTNSNIYIVDHTLHNRKDKIEYSVTHKSG